MSYVYDLSYDDYYSYPEDSYFEEPRYSPPPTYRSPPVPTSFYDIPYPTFSAPYTPKVYADYEPSYAAIKTEYGSDEKFQKKMEAILGAHPCIGVPYEPSEITSYVYLGTQANAENPDLLKRIGIKFIVNCAGKKKLRPKSRRSFFEESGICGYEEFYLEDEEDFNILPYFDQICSCIEVARRRGLRVLIHCSGVSRSGAVAIAYLVRNGIPLLEATKQVKKQRRVALCNDGFMKQLIKYARDRSGLDPDVDSVRAPSFGGPRDKYRLMSAHLPTFL